MGHRVANYGLAGPSLALVAALLAGCSVGERPTELSPQPTEDAELVCGIVREDVEASLGLAVGHVEDDLTGGGVQVEGTCEVRPEDDSVVDGAMLFVRVHPGVSPEGRERQDELDGEVPGVREPEVRFADAEGGVWFRDVSIRGRRTLGGISVLVTGDHVVAVTSAKNDPDRNVAEDLLALSEQVAVTYDLAEAEAEAQG